MYIFEYQVPVTNHWQSIDTYFPPDKSYRELELLAPDGNGMVDVRCRSRHGGPETISVTLRSKERLRVQFQNGWTCEIRMQNAIAGDAPSVRLYCEDMPSSGSLTGIFMPTQTIGTPWTGGAPWDESKPDDGTIIPQDP